MLRVLVLYHHLMPFFNTSPKKRGMGEVLVVIQGENTLCYCLIISAPPSSCCCRNTNTSTPSELDGVQKAPPFRPVTARPRAGPESANYGALSLEGTRSSSYSGKGRLISSLAVLVLILQANEVIVQCKGM